MGLSGSRIRRAILAALFVACAVAARIALSALGGSSAFFEPFYIAVAAAGLMGLEAGAIAAFLSLLATLLLVPSLCWSRGKAAARAVKPPERCGLGSRLFESVFASEGGSAALAYEEAGLTARLTFRCPNEDATAGDAQA